jgi:EAL domain-containing protein (putative c-di-GMP-specific phosphodiesterase class I)
VASIINLGHSLELECVAEGVENIQQANILRELACDSFQGFLISPAVNLESIEEMLKNSQYDKLMGQ